MSMWVRYAGAHPRVEAAHHERGAFRLEYNHHLCMVILALLQAQEDGQDSESGAV